MSANKKKVPKMMETLAKLVNADKLRVEYTEYELSAEVGSRRVCESDRRTIGEGREGKGREGMSSQRRMSFVHSTPFFF